MTVSITGNTYPVKDQLRAMGGRWDADNKAWVVPDDKAAEARAIVAGAGTKQPATIGARRSFSACRICGAKADRYHRIYGSGECRDCYEERKMGY